MTCLWLCDGLGHKILTIFYKYENYYKRIYMLLSLVSFGHFYIYNLKKKKSYRKLIGKLPVKFYVGESVNWPNYTILHTTEFLLENKRLDGVVAHLKTI